MSHAKEADPATQHSLPTGLEPGGRPTPVAEHRLRAFFEMSGDAMGLALENRYVLVNPAFARLFRYEHPEELVGLPTLGNFAPGEQARILDYQRRRAAGEPLPPTYLSRGLRRDGSEFDAELQAFGFREEEGRYTAAIVRDVTEERSNAARLLESERRFRELFELTPVALWEQETSGLRARLRELRAAGVEDLRAHLEAHPELVRECVAAARIRDANPAAWHTFGARSREELIGSLPRLYAPESVHLFRELLVQIDEDRPLLAAEGWLAALDGSRRWVQFVGRTFPEGGDPAGRALVATLDDTARRLADDERAALQDRLRQAEKLEAVGRLAGGVAHDFNNILSGILGYAEVTMLEAAPGSDAQENCRRIKEAALRARDLVRQILTFSRRDRSSRDLVDVPSVVHEALGLMRAGIPSSATLSARIDPAAGATLADPTQLHQVVLNLCANARDAIGTYGRIEVTVDPVDGGAVPGLAPGRWIRLRVKDDGVGMDEATRARIFEPFMTTKGPHGGHGLGLAVVHGIVSGAGGVIQVESAPSRGSAFSVYLPRHDGRPVPAAEPPLAEGRGERLLVVDDEPVVLGAHKRVLEAMGYVVEVARDGEEALARFREAPDAFALVLTDQTMPRLEGDDLARSILAIRPGARVLLCTGYSDRVDPESARRIGVRGLLEKPMERDTLAAAVRKALDEP